MAGHGHNLEGIEARIEPRKPDLVALIVLQVLPTQLMQLYCYKSCQHKSFLTTARRKVLRVRMIMKEWVNYFNPVYLFDEGSTISWILCGRKLTCSYPGIKFNNGPDAYYDKEASVFEMDGQFDRLDELKYEEIHLINISTKFYGGVTQQKLKHAVFPGSNNGIDLFQAIVGLLLHYKQPKPNEGLSRSIILFIIYHV